ncbi:helix-turn-helix domain-containing protein [Myroides sp. M-43]|uniref:helix-turn-helix domain-containing protein n=1 Tax=Myroides oncorhynchi TaxID=2893756 RepID=UPI001E2C23E2|nr:helix-turn-helix domain-containing protein [Myroides oncorhynchi]MCC9041297.1 helix-turn-helix domain-containing protein [Myroides oncorhynchi]
MKLLSSPYNVENDRAIFEKVVALSILLILLQFVTEFSTTVLTTGYFILPIIYVLVKYDRTQVNILQKSTIHFIVTLTITLLAFNVNEILYETLNIVYLLTYVISIYHHVNKHLIVEKVSHEIYNFIGLYCFYILAGSGVCIFYLVMDLIGNKYEVASQFVLGGFDFFAIVFCILTLVVSRSHSKILMETTTTKSKVTRETTPVVYEKSNEHIRNIIEYFEQSDTILELGFDLDQLAKDLNLSKQQVSEIINQDMNSSFYQLLAMYRIDHAKSLIGNNKNLTIEAIVDECGFSSKSTFNKYFKYYVGQTPSMYRNAVV